MHGIPFIYLLLILPSYVNAKIMWSAGNFTVVDVDATFSYNIRMGKDNTWLKNGTVGVTCNGTRYSSDVGTLQGVSPAYEVDGVDQNLGKFKGYARKWHAGKCTSLTSTIRYYLNKDSFEFILKMPDLDATNGTATMPLSSRSGIGYKPVPATTSTEFPSFEVPSSKLGVGFIEWNAEPLNHMESLQRPSLGQSADFNKYIGGLLSGPLVLFGASGIGKPIESLVLSPSSEFKVGIITRVNKRIVAGVQGMVNSLPANYSLSFILVGRRNGVNNVMQDWGEILQRQHQTARFTLLEDILSSTIHYENDNGANYCYCKWWPKCVSSSVGCEPMHVTLEKLENYYTSLNVTMGLYHLDPFWWSQEPYGGCKQGATATNMSASPFHFPNGLGALDLPMFLIIKYINPTNNIYLSKGWDFDGKSVTGSDSMDFWLKLFEYHTNVSNLKALVWDGLDQIMYSSDSRVNNTYTQYEWHSGFVKAASEYGLPIRMDMSTPSDILASLDFKAHTVSRCTPDAVPGRSSTWNMVGGNSLFLGALGIRPMMDVLWTTTHQPNNPYGKDRPNVEHDAIIATLSTGPVGIGDMIGSTNSSLLAHIIRTDGIILKPAYPVKRLDRYYTIPLPSPTPPPSPRPPSKSGCSDGSCDSFCDLPNVRGCAANWIGTSSMRAAGSGTPCGNKPQITCDAPIDACAEGWLPCLTPNSSGQSTLAEFQKAINSTRCAAGDTIDITQKLIVNEVYVTAMSHTGVKKPPCPKVPDTNHDYGCRMSNYGSEPICCGSGSNCGVPSCSTGVWIKNTTVFFKEDHQKYTHRGCGNLAGDAATGVLCCRIASSSSTTTTTTTRYIDNGERFEIWAAPTAPATFSDPRIDGVANSFAKFSLGDGYRDHNGDDELLRWWWLILLTDVDNKTAGGQPLSIHELDFTNNKYNTKETTQYLVWQFGQSLQCEHGKVASSCLSVWNTTELLNVGTNPTSGRSFRLLFAAPVLSSHWVLLGDLRKFVPCSPQRFISHATTNDVDLTFDVIGAIGESIPVTLVSPPIFTNVVDVEKGFLVVVNVVIGSSGRVTVTCSNGTCKKKSSHINV